jgi:rod shape-determining protein MreC
MAVISEEGVVGIVLESSSNFASIIPIINRDFRLSAKIKKNNFVGIIQWDGHDHRIASLNEIPYHAEVSEGDSIVTSGFSSIFPEGLYVGKVHRASMEEGNFYEIDVRLGTDFQRLFHVNIIENYKQKEQRELEQAIRE